MIKCTRCGSEKVLINKRGFSLLTGFIGANKLVSECLRCGYKTKVKPETDEYETKPGKNIAKNMYIFWGIVSIILFILILLKVSGV